MTFCVNYFEPRLW